MNNKSEKQKPSHPFTMVDVEVMRAMRIRLTRRRFRITLVLQTIILLLILIWVAFIVTTTAIPGSMHARLTSDWVILVTMLLGASAVSAIVITVKKYKAALRFLEDPTTHPDLIINGELQDTTLAVQKTAP